ncbi:MAG TPA: transglycosylase SLT domain-containing protein, partial [Polyangiaceae bacterium]
LVVPGCDDGGIGNGSASADDGGGGDDGSTSGACSPDPLHTGLTAQQTGVSVDAFDCPILAWTAKYAEPDAMVFKAIIYVESRFDDTSVACPNLPCGTPGGWTAAESGCFGLMQVVPACGGTPNSAGLLPDGHPNLTTDPSSNGWAGSIFNPDNNIEIGIAGIAGNRAQVKTQFPGCTEDQYTMMAVGNYNSYGSTKSCTVVNKAYDDAVIAAYKQYAAAAGYPPHGY